MRTKKIILAAFILLPLTTRAVSIPQVEILVPAIGVRIAVETPVEMLLSVENFIFVDFKNNRERFPGNPDAGYAVLWIDPKDQLLPAAGEKLLSESVVKLGNLSEGEHRLVVELFRNDLSAFEPPIRAETSFVVGENDVVTASSSSGLLWTLFFGLLLFLLVWKVWKRFNRHSQEPHGT